MTKAERLLASSRLFSGAEQQTVRTAVRAGETLDFAKGERIVFPEGGLGILQKGKLKVGARGDLRRLTVSQLEEGAVFGFASLYEGEERFSSDIHAASETTVLFLPERLLDGLIAEDPAVARNIIAIQAAKIRFLNERIRAFTASTGVKKLCGYLQSLPREEDGSVRLPMGMAPLAARLGMSRVSLYRAVKELENAGKIRKDGAGITILRDLC